MFKVLRVWIPIAIVTAALCLLVYATVQQNYRQGANDPQIQIAEDLADSLSLGKQIDSQMFTNKIDISKSLSPYVMVFNRDGKIVIGNAVLDGKTPELPKGVFGFAKTFGENRFTWQPKEEVRSAVVLKWFDGKNSGYVLAGRSLREVEIREKRLELMVGGVFLATLFSAFIVILIFK